MIDIGCLDFFITPSAPHPINRSGLAVYQIHIADFLRQIQEVSSSLIFASILPADPPPEALSFEGTFLVPAPSLIGKAPGAGTGDGGAVLTGPVAVLPVGLGVFFGDVELGLELWTVIAGISGFDV